MVVEFRTTYPVLPRVVLGVLTDGQFLSGCAAAVGALDQQTDVTHRRGRWATDTRLVLATTRAPSYLQAMLGDRVQVRLSRAWTPAGSNAYRCTWELRAQVRSLTAMIQGTVQLERVGNGTAFLALGDIVELTLPGSLRSRAVTNLEALSQSALATEADLALEWLRR